MPEGSKALQSTFVCLLPWAEVGLTFRDETDGRRAGSRAGLAHKSLELSSAPASLYFYRLYLGPDFHLALHAISFVHKVGGQPSHPGVQRLIGLCR